MLICLNCLSEQSDPNATACEFCRMPGMLQQKSGGMAAPVPQVQSTGILRCPNCAEEIEDGMAQQCPHCRVPLAVSRATQKKKITEPETRHIIDRAHFSVATGSVKRI